MKYQQNYGKPGNSMTYVSNTVMPYINQNIIDRWTTSCTLPLGKNFQGVKFRSIAAKIYNALQRPRIDPKIKKILRKN